MKNFTLPPREKNMEKQTFLQQLISNNIDFFIGADNQYLRTHKRASIKRSENVQVEYFVTIDIKHLTVNSDGFEGFIFGHYLMQEEEYPDKYSKYLSESDTKELLRIRDTQFKRVLENEYGAIYTPNEKK